MSKLNIDLKSIVPNKNDALFLLIFGIIGTIILAMMLSLISESRQMCEITCKEGYHTDSYSYVIGSCKCYDDANINLDTSDDMYLNFNNVNSES